MSSPSGSQAPAAARRCCDREKILAAAFALVEAHGLEKLTTRRLAEALGISGPSLYWHFASMAELREAMAEQLVARAVPAPPAGRDWRGWLADGARGLRREALARRDGAMLIAGLCRSAGVRTRFTEAGLEALSASGLDPLAARWAVLALSRYALGAALAEETGEERSEGAFEFGLSAFLTGVAPEAEPSEVLY